MWRHSACSLTKLMFYVGLRSGRFRQIDKWSNASYYLVSRNSLLPEWTRDCQGEIFHLEGVVFIADIYNDTYSSALLDN